jgi:hypothetical protein
MPCDVCIVSSRCCTSFVVTHQQTSLFLFHFCLTLDALPQFVHHIIQVCTTHKIEGADLDTTMTWAEAQSELALKAQADYEADKQAALDEQAALFEAKMRRLKESGVLLDAEATERARREAEAEAARLERERERAREDLIKVSTLIREANALAEELNINARYRIEMRLSLQALCNPGEETSESREIAVAEVDHATGATRVIQLDPFMAQLNRYRDAYVNHCHFLPRHPRRPFQG